MIFDLSGQTFAQSLGELAVHVALYGGPNMAQRLKPLDITLDCAQTDHEQAGDSAFALALLPAFDDLARRSSEYARIVASSLDGSTPRFWLGQSL